MISAAGGVLWRPSPNSSPGAGGACSDGIEVVVVHRPRYDDWSLPKGKLNTLEPPVVGAAREVEEETGCRPAVQRWLARTSYRVEGTRKVVDYWAMRCLGGEFGASDEVDEIRWLPPDDAAPTLQRDRTVLRAFRARPIDTTTVLLVRHARAGSKKGRSGHDSLRPLDETGHRQAARLAEMLPVFRPVKVISADRVRCVDTVGLVAQRLGVEVEIDPAFNEADRAHARQAADRLRSLALLGRPVVVCSQGGVIPETLAVLTRHSPVKLGAPSAGKGSVWALSFDRGGGLVGADYYPPPPVT